MKYILLFLALICIAVPSFAKCGYSSIYTLNSKSTLSRNGRVILVFYGQAQEYVPHLNTKYPIYLQAGDKKVSLLPVETYIGNFRLTEVVLKPDTLLDAGATYTLLIDSLPKYARFEDRYNALTNKWEPNTFIITRTIDNTKPIFSAAPKQKSKNFQRLGCGPESHVFFSLKSKDRSELFALTSVKSKEGGEIQKFILAIHGDSVGVGRGMCSGEFSLGECQYEVTFQLMDAAGNLSALSKPLNFTAANHVQQYVKRK